MGRVSGSPMTVCSLRVSRRPRPFAASCEVSLQSDPVQAQPLPGMAASLAVPASEQPVSRRGWVHRQPALCLSAGPDPLMTSRSVNKASTHLCRACVSPLQPARGRQRQRRVASFRPLSRLERRLYASLSFPILDALSCGGTKPSRREQATSRTPGCGTSAKSRGGAIYGNV